MSLFSHLIKSTATFLGLRETSVASVSSSSDPFIELKKLCKEEAPTIFDVGAHYGFISLKFRSIFPMSTVYAFEPFPESYRRLEENCGKDPLIKTFNFGLSSERGNHLLSSNSNEQTNSLLETDERGAGIWGSGLLETKERLSVYFDTVDFVLEQKKIPAIDILKMDVQGAEYLVMKGAAKAMASEKIRLVYTEIITLPTYKNQKPFHEVLKLFCDYGFQLHDFYNLSRTEEGNLRQVDAIFVRS